jgi:hypothetical protein
LRSKLDRDFPRKLIHTKRGIGYTLTSVDTPLQELNTHGKLVIRGNDSPPTFLRNYTKCPKGLRRFWLGHAGQDMGYLHDKIKEDFQFRHKWAEKAGLGLQLPRVVPAVPRIAEKDGGMGVA